MKALAILLTTLALAGCQPPVEKPVFKDEIDELRYLRSLSNPTPEQWKRKTEMDASDVAKDLDHEEKYKRFLKGE